MWRRPKNRSVLGKSAPQRTPYRSLQRNKAVMYHDTDTDCKALGFFTEYCCFCRNGGTDFFALSSRDVLVCFGWKMLFISFYLGNYMTGLVPFKVLILVSNERGFVQQQRFLLY